MFSNKAIAIRDAQVQDFIQSVGLNVNAIINPAHFVEQHKEWLRNNNFYVEGLDKFAHGYVTAGCTEAFNEVYKEPCFVLAGEYTYHRDAGVAVQCPIDSVPSNSRLIISYPFAATGNPHQDWESILEICSKRNIKVFVDACLAGVSIGKLDLRHPAITHVAFSFSKAFYTGFYRCGVVYTNDAESIASTLNKHLYLNHPSLDLHLKLMTEFSSDYIVDKYRLKQGDICREHNLEISDCVLFGLDNGLRQCLSPVLGTRLPFPLHHSKQ